MQTVAEFVKERRDVVVREKRRLVADGLREVAYEVSNRSSHCPVG